MGRLIIVGQSLSFRASRQLLEGPFAARKGILAGRSGRFLADILGMDYRAYICHTERINLVDVCRGKAGKRDSFDMRLARLRAAELIPTWTGRFVVMLGRRVCTAILGTVPPVLQWFPISFGRSDAFMAAHLPHPSGINRWWNEEANVESAKRFFGDFRSVKKNAD